MSNSTTRRWQQTKRPRLFFLGSIVFLLLIIWWLWARGEVKTYAGRTTVVVAQEPTLIASWDNTNGSLVLITIPEESVIEAQFGYGRYSFRGLWGLGEIDNKGGLVLSESVGAALGIPVPYFVGPDGQEEQELQEGAFERVRAVFSLSRGLGIVTGRTQTNMPLRVWIAMIRNLALLRPDRVTTVTFRESFGLAKKSVPDGSVLLELDPSQTDVLLEGVFENEEIRREALAVAVYNTTSVSAVGTRAARLLSNIGYVVVAVDNAQPERGECEVLVGEAKAKSTSALLLRDLFACTIIPKKEPMRADIMIYLGSKYASRFIGPGGE